MNSDPTKILGSSRTGHSPWHWQQGSPGAGGDVAPVVVEDVAHIEQGECYHEEEASKPKIQFLSVQTYQEEKMSSLLLHPPLGPNDNPTQMFRPIDISTHERQLCDIFKRRTIHQYIDRNFLRNRFLITMGCPGYWRRLPYVHWGIDFLARGTERSWVKVPLGRNDWVELSLRQNSRF